MGAQERPTGVSPWHLRRIAVYRYLAFTPELQLWPSAKFDRPMRSLYLTLFATLALATVVSGFLAAREVYQELHHFFLRSRYNPLHLEERSFSQDTGRGMRTEDSAMAEVNKSDAPITYRFPFRISGEYQACADPAREASVTFSHAKLIDGREKIIRRILPSQFRAGKQINSLQTNGDSVQMTTTAGANDAILILSFHSHFL